MAETDLYLPVKKFLQAQGYEVKGEIGACDVFGYRTGEPPVIVELKTSFSLQLLYQAIDRQALSDHVYVAIPQPKTAVSRDALSLCRRLGLGLLTVTSEWVEAVLDPAPYRPKKNLKRTKQLLKEFQHRAGDPNLGGSSKRPVMTSYRQDVLRCVFYLRRFDCAKLSDIKDGSGVDRASSLLQRDVYGWFERRERGHYGLSQQGHKALTLYADFMKSLDRDLERRAVTRS